MTPRMTPHAVQRCQEMGISTKVAKRIVQDPCRMTYPSPPGYEGSRLMVHSKRHPEYLVILDSDEWAVVTVLLYSDERLSREEANRLARQVLT